MIQWSCVADKCVCRLTAQTQYIQAQNHVKHLEANLCISSTESANEFTLNTHPSTAGIRYIGSSTCISLTIHWDSNYTIYGMMSVLWSVRYRSLETSATTTTSRACQCSLQTVFPLFPNLIIYYFGFSVIQLRGQCHSKRIVSSSLSCPFLAAAKHTVTMWVAKLNRAHEIGRSALTLLQHVEWYLVSTCTPLPEWTDETADNSQSNAHLGVGGRFLACFPSSCRSTASL